MRLVAKAAAPSLAAVLASILASTACGPAGSSRATVPAGGAPSADAPGAGAPAYQSGPPREVVSIEGITEYQLDNGLRVLLFPDPSQATVTVNITYFVGSRHEGYGETGMAHLLEHMVFKGTPTHPEIWKLLEDHGADFNGTTWYDRTNYYETMPASDENLAFAIALEADRMIHSKIAAEDLATEFSVVRNEFELGENNPRGVLEERMLSTAYLWHNYGKSTIGSKSDIERVPVDNLRAFYEKYYQPDNAMLVVAGQFDEARALDLITRHFGAIPPPARELAPTHTVEPVQDGERAVTLRRVGDVAVVGLLYHAPAGSHPDFPAVDALAHVLTDEPSGRLYKALVETGMATSVSSNAWGFAEPSTLQVFAEVRAGRPLEPVRDKMIAIVEGLGAAAGKAAITDDDVARYRSRQAKNLELAMADSKLIAVLLTEWAALGDWRMLFVIRDRIAGVDAARVRRVASEYLVRDNRTLGMFIPTPEPRRAPLPDTPDVLAMVKDYRGKEQMAQGEAFEATVANVEARTARKELPGGMQLAMLPKETRGDAVKVVITLRYGAEADLRGKLAAIDLIPAMLMRGTRTRTFQQLRDELDRLKAEVSFGAFGFGGGSLGATTATITTKREHLVDVIALVAEMFQRPALPAGELQIVIKERLAQLEEQLAEPTARAFVAAQRALSPWPKGDVRYEPTLEERIAQLKAVRLADIKTFHQRYWGASHAQVAVVGDFDAAAVEAAVAQHFGGWKSPRPYVRVATPFRPGKAGLDVIETPDKKMAIVLAAHNVQMKDDHPDYPALTMATYILGGSASSRLLNRLRQKEGLSYGAFGGLQVDALDDAGGLFAAAICAPENADKALTYLLEEIDLLIARGVTDAELADSIASYKKQFHTRLADDDYLASRLAAGLYLGRTMEFQQKLLDAVSRLTPADISRALATYVKPALLYKVRAGDFAGGK